jgi:uncharacterized sporulation protein YeaH/YhbH (DUF444 family)
MNTAVVKLTTVVEKFNGLSDSRKHIETTLQSLQPKASVAAVQQTEADVEKAVFAILYPENLWSKRAREIQDYVNKHTLYWSAFYLAFFRWRKTFHKASARQITLTRLRKFTADLGLKNVAEDVMLADLELLIQRGAIARIQRKRFTSFEYNPAFKLESSTDKQNLNPGDKKA